MGSISGNIFFSNISIFLVAIFGKIINSLVLIRFKVNLYYLYGRNKIFHTESISTFKMDHSFGTLRAIFRRKFTKI
jgi:hypothetical protein